MNTPHAPLILDIAGTQLSPTDRRRLAHPLTGGLILFARNWVNRAQLTALCQDIKDPVSYTHLTLPTNREV